jgi:hypothetical protein
MRSVLASNRELAQRLAKLESTTAALSTRHDSLAQQLTQVVVAIRALTAMPSAPEKRPIGFVISEQKEK